MSELSEYKARPRMLRRQASIWTVALGGGALLGGVLDPAAAGEDTPMAGHADPPATGHGDPTASHGDDGAEEGEGRDETAHGGPPSGALPEISLVPVAGGRPQGFGAGPPLGVTSGPA